MPNSMEMRSYYKRVLLMLKQIEQQSGNLAIVKQHILAIETEMDQEDIVHVEKKLKGE